MSTTELDRSMLDGKDREELHAIAAAVGVKAPTRMRKAELVNAILEAAGGGAADTVPGGNGGAAAETPRARTVRSAQASQVDRDSVAALAAEEEAIASVDDADPQIAPRPRRGATSAAETPAPEARRATTATSDTETETDAGGRAGDGGDFDVDDERSSYGDGNVRRRRRRGRGRGQAGYENEPRPNEPVGEPVEVEGLLELRDEGYGFLRTTGYLAGSRDVYVSASQVRRFALRKGDFVKGFSRPQASNEKYPALLRVDEINGMTPDDARQRSRFEDLTPLFPDEKLRLELSDNPLEITGRIVDLIAPIG